MENKKQELLAFINKSIVEAQKNLDLIRETINISEISNQLKVETPLTESSLIFSFNSLITIGKLETAIQLKNILTVSSDWEQKYFLKLACLSIKTVLETYEIYPEKLKNFVSRYPDLIDVWDEISDEVSSFKLTFYPENQVEEIVNTTVAKIDADFKKYYDTFTGINIDKAKNMLLEFIILLEKIFLFSYECLEIDTDKNIDIDKVKKNLMELRLRIEAIRNAYKNLN